MIASKYRFHGYGALKFLFGHGKTFRFKSLSLRVAQNQRREHSRLSVVVSKKVLKAAPKRNQVRRRVYEALRANWEHVAPGHDLLLSVHNPNILELNHQELTRELQQALEGARVWRDKPTENH